MPVKINGLTNGSVTLAAPDTGSDTTLTLPSASGTVQTVPGAWTTYTPSLTSWAVGNGTLSGSYVQIGKTVTFKIKLTAGSTTTFTSVPTFGLPVTAISGDELYAYNCIGFDSSINGYFFGNIIPISTTGIQPAWRTTALTYSVGASIPFTPATSDIFYFSGTYEAA